MAAGGARAISFCLHGPPGTAKSAFARHLAGRLGLDVVEKRASDLLSMWVGETEKGIARAFEEAADERGRRPDRDHQSAIQFASGYEPPLRMGPAAVLEGDLHQIV
ncbi:MAG: AAA family ATPase [Caulobacteraceae bacterium]